MQRKLMVSHHREIIGEVAPLHIFTQCPAMLRQLQLIVHYGRAARWDICLLNLHLITGTSASPSLI